MSDFVNAARNALSSPAFGTVNGSIDKMEYFKLQALLRQPISGKEQIFARQFLDATSMGVHRQDYVRLVQSLRAMDSFETFEARASEARASRTP